MSQTKWYHITRTKLDVIASAAMIVAAAVLVWVNLFQPRQRGPQQPTVEVPKDPVSIAGAEFEGSRRAPIAIVEFADYECPFCRTFAATIYPTLKEKYVDSGKVAFFFRHMPLSTIHPFARKAATSSICASAQGKFWQMHGLLLKGPPLSDLVLTAHVETAGLKADLFQECILVPSVQVDKDVAMARALSIKSTPTFLLGYLNDQDVTVKQVLVGARGVDQFDEVVDELLATRSRNR